MIRHQTYKGPLSKTYNENLGKGDLLSPSAAQLGLDPPKLECQVSLPPKAFTRANMPK